MDKMKYRSSVSHTTPLQNVAIVSLLNGTVHSKQVITWKQPGFQKYRYSIVTEEEFFFIPEKKELLVTFRGSIVGRWLVSKS